MKLFILISSLVLVYCRPQSQYGNKPPIEFQTEVSVNSESYTQKIFRDYGTKEKNNVTYDILKKIEAINQKHGYTTRTPIKKDFDYFPHFYTYSHQHTKPLRRVNAEGEKTQRETINPILEEKQYVDDNLRIKRKITHQQSYYVPQREPPVQYLLVMPPVIPSYPVQPLNRYNYLKQAYGDRYVLEQQLLDNLKSIILNTQLPPKIEGMTFNPLVQNLPYENTFMQYYKPELYSSPGYVNNIPNMPYNVYQNDGYAPNSNEEQVLKSNTPFTIYKSLTTITEYDNDNTENCKFNNNIDNFRNGKSLVDNPELTPQKYRVDVGKSIEVAAFSDDNHWDKDKKNTKKDDSSLTSENLSQIRSEKLRKIPKPTEEYLEKDTDKTFLNPIQNLFTKNKTPPTPQASDKDLINENGKKVFSKDNTGSGIFIQRLKVRRGGVAIAGPGGIATAGSGGTAIVGPNGYAYTHPDSLAIAGSGSKVIAVDPRISLSDIVKGKEDGSRVGRVVAVGPVIYYNKG